MEKNYLTKKICYVKDDDNIIFYILKKSNAIKILPGTDKYEKIYRELYIPSKLTGNYFSNK